MALEFDLTTYPDFLRTLLDLGSTVPEEFFDEIERIKATLPWGRFSADCQWTPHVVATTETYPGLPELFTFRLDLPSAQVLVYGFLMRTDAVVCTVATACVPPRTTPPGLKRNR